MTNLKLVQYLPIKGFPGLIGHSSTTKTIAVSTSYSSLVKYCKDNFGEDIGVPESVGPNGFFTIEPSEIKIIQENY